jgi:hypothetical protein
VGAEKSSSVVERESTHLIGRVGKQGSNSMLLPRPPKADQKAGSAGTSTQRVIKALAGNLRSGANS